LSIATGQRRHDPFPFAFAVSPLQILRPFTQTHAAPAPLGPLLLHLHLHLHLAGRSLCTTSPPTTTVEPLPPCLGSSPRVCSPAARLLCVLVLTHSTELKETHLAPLANTFSRSSSTSTIVDQQTPKASTSPANSNAAIGDPNGIGASQPVHALPRETANCPQRPLKLPRRLRPSDPVF
jgi:hypothetical protein